jgi:hypothetical protein
MRRLPVGRGQIIESISASSGDEGEAVVIRQRGTDVRAVIAGGPGGLGCGGCAVFTEIGHHGRNHRRASGALREWSGLQRGQPVALASIAGPASRDEVVVVIDSTLGDRRLVIDMQDDIRRMLAAVLAGEIVALQDSPACEVPAVNVSHSQECTTYNTSTRSNVMPTCSGGDPPACCQPEPLTLAQQRVRVNLPTRCPSCGERWPLPSFGADWWLWTCASLACGRSFVHGA